MKEIEKIGQDIFKYNGEVYRLMKKEYECICYDICPLYGENNGDCGTICLEAYEQLDNPGFTFGDTTFVKVTETKNETNMKENGTDYKSLYEETISKLKIAKKNIGCYTFSSVIDKVIPEVAESEDESLKRELIQYLKDCSILPCGHYSRADFFAWIEKQGEQKDEKTNPYKSAIDSIHEMCNSYEYNGTFKDDRAIDFLNNIRVKCLDAELYDDMGREQKPIEQKPTDRVEPEFKVKKGGWYVCTNTFVSKGKIIAIKGQTYQSKQEDNTITCEDNCLFIDRHDGKAADYFRPWTIQDAKSGDVLATEGFIFIFKEIREDKGVGYFCANEKELHEGDDSTFHIANPNSLMGSINNDFTHYTPATKEQRELLFQKMKEEGYEWNVETLELKKIEQNPTDKAERKFKVGDWIISSEGTLRHIVAVGKRCYETDKGWLTHDDYERRFHLWTIQDAKDGDVLSTRLSPEGDWIGIYKDSCEFGFNTHCFVNGIMEFVSNSYWCTNHGTQGIHPATKEQCDLLFSKMKEAGYEWDAEKKELRKIEQKLVEYNREDEQNLNACLGYIPDEFLRRWLKDIIHIKYDKPVWCEEDEKTIDEAVEKLEKYAEYVQGGNSKRYILDLASRVESLKDRMLPQTKQEVCEDTSTSEYIDLGLPSGTLWKISNEKGYYTYDEVVEKFSNQLPTKEQWEELRNECKWEWKDNEYKVIGPNGNNIFLPAAGYRFGTGVYDLGTEGNYWSGTCICEGSAYSMCFRDGNIGMYYYYRGSGLSVRLVK